MTPSEGIHFVKLLEKHYKQDFHSELVDLVWPRIIMCEIKALAIAVNMVKRKYKILPEPEILARITEGQHKRLATERTEVLKQEVAVATKTDVGMPDWVKKRAYELGLRSSPT